MRRILLVARHEFIRYVTRRGFIISIVLMPTWVLFAAMVPRWIENNAPPRSFMVVDRSGGYAGPIADAVAARDAKDAFEGLARYARAHADLTRLHAGDSKLFALFAAPEGEHAALARFRAAGGTEAVLHRLRPFLRDAAPPFSPRPPRFIDLPPPPTLASASRTAFAARAASLLAHEKGPDAILVVPRGFGRAANAQAQYWSAGPPKPALKDFLESALTQALRARALHRIAPAASADLLGISATLRSLDPSRKNGSASTLVDQVQRYTPAALAFLLVLTIFMNAASLMSAVIEEKSSRIVEVMLSCIGPRDFMIGKLLGAAGASLLTLSIWLTAGIAAAWYFIPGGPGLVVALASGLATGPLLPMLLVCFVCGLLIYASIFLALGSMTASIQDAQALIGPTMILIMAPLLLMPALLRDPNGTIATVMTWIPVYTPFFMMFRLPWHPPPLQVWLSVALMIATAGLLVWQMGRVFASHVLTAERPPRLGAALRTLVGLKKAG